MGTREFVGKGVTFPWRFDARSGGVARDPEPSVEQQFKRVQQSCLIIVGVRRGEIECLNGFGSDTHNLIFVLDSMNLEERVGFSITRALEDPVYGEHRALIDAVDVFFDRRAGRADASANVRLRSSNIPGNIVWPFYLNDQDRGAAESSGS